MRAKIKIVIDSDKFESIEAFKEYVEEIIDDLAFSISGDVETEIEVVE